MSETTFNHPILHALRSALGVANVPTNDVEYAGHVFSIRDITPEEYEYAGEMINRTAASDAKRRGLIDSLAQMSCAISAIDGTPLFELFGVTVPDGLVDKNFPPINVRQQCSTYLFNMLREESRMEAATGLFEAYFGARKPTHGEEIPLP